MLYAILYYFMNISVDVKTVSLFLVEVIDLNVFVLSEKILCCCCC